MHRLVIACYCANFDDYDLYYRILDRLRFADVGAELSMFSDKPEYTARLILQEPRFRQTYVTFHGPFFEVEATSPLDSPGHRQIVEAYQESFGLYHRFHAHSLVMHTNQRSYRPGEKAGLQRNAIATLREISNLAAAEGVELLVENVGEGIFENMLFDEDEFVALFESLPPSAGCLVDIGHAIVNDWDLERVVRRLGTRIKAYHLHNNDGTGDTHRPLFEAGMKRSPEELQALFRAMEARTPQADWILEYAPGDHITPELIAAEATRLLAMIERR